MRLRSLLANNTALTLTTLALGTFGSGCAFAQDMVLPDTGMATPPAETELHSETSPKVSREDKTVSAEDVDTGMATPPSDLTPETTTTLYGTDTEKPSAKADLPVGFTLLQLDVKINGVKTGYISSFYLMADGGLASTRSELEQLRIAVSGGGPADQIVMLQDLPTATYIYNETEQSIDIQIGASQRLLQDIKTREELQTTDVASGNGLLLNYNVFSAVNGKYNFKDTTTSGISAQLEARAFTDWGTLETSGIVSTPDFKVAENTRLNTTLYFDDPKRLLEYQFGDLISGGTNWSRPVRLGGGQVRRNFAMRPDLITMPLPEVSGTAGVPSTVDIFVGGTRAYVGEVGEGPFRAENIPVLTNEGTVRVVLTDATGREVEAEGEFFTSPNLLKPKLFDFSLEAGFLRESFGSKSFDYSEYAAAVASMRYGITDILTAESHAEVSEELQNGGVGLLMAVPYLGSLNVAAAGSLYDGKSGYMLYGSWEKRLGNFMLNAATTRTFGDYNDLASVNAFEVNGNLDGGIPKAIDQITVGYAIPRYEANATVNLIHVLDRDNTRDMIVSGTVSKSYGHINMFGSGFVNFGDQDDYGLSLGFSMPLGSAYTTSNGATKTKNGYELGASISKAHNDKDYSTAWTLNYDRNTQNRASAKGELRAPIGTANADLEMRESGLSGSLAYSGAAVFTKGGVLLGRHVGDTFAIVDAGASDVLVRHEHQYVGHTGRNGQLLVNNIAAYARNKFDIDLDSLALTAESLETEKHVIPRRRSGVIVDFNVQSQTKSAVVKIEDAGGTPIPVSTEIVLDGNPEPFVMGYDGEVYLTGLLERNSISVNLPTGICKVEFAYSGNSKSQEFIGPLKCV